jgi:hypothetical protein
MSIVINRNMLKGKRSVTFILIFSLKSKDGSRSPTKYRDYSQEDSSFLKRYYSASPSKEDNKSNDFQVLKLIKM